MAFSQKFLAFNKGSRNEDYIEFTADATGSGAVVTRLRYIDGCDIAQKGTSGVATDAAFSFQRNRSDATTRKGGSIFVTGCVNGARYTIRAMGK